MVLQVSFIEDYVSKLEELSSNQISNIEKIKELDSPLPNEISLTNEKIEVLDTTILLVISTATYLTYFNLIPSCFVLFHPITLVLMTSCLFLPPVLIDVSDRLKDSLAKETTFLRIAGPVVLALSVFPCSLTCMFLIIGSCYSSAMDPIVLGLVFSSYLTCKFLPSTVPQ